MLENRLYGYSQHSVVDAFFATAAAAYVVNFGYDVAECLEEMNEEDDENDG